MCWQESKGKKINYQKINQISKLLLGSNKIILRSQQKLGSTLYSVFRENVNKIVLSENDEWWESSNVRVIVNLYDTGPGRVCEEELMEHLEIENWV